jgi:hypothetical protein
MSSVTSRSLTGSTGRGFGRRSGPACCWSSYRRPMSAGRRPGQIHPGRPPGSAPARTPAATSAPSPPRAPAHPATRKSGTGAPATRPRPATTAARTRATAATLAPVVRERLPVGGRQRVRRRTRPARVARAEPPPHRAHVDVQPGRGQSHMRRGQRPRRPQRDQPRHRRSPLLRVHPRACQPPRPSCRTDRIRSSVRVGLRAESPRDQSLAGLCAAAARHLGSLLTRSVNPVVSTSLLWVLIKM